MVDLTWKVFSQTGNIETYLLMKELENATSVQENGQAESENIASLDAKL
ncbi:YqzL family protein [Oceanobacillus rekensis]|nr:YqzL family protein [Oceanobacillus rekensis]